MPDDLTIAYFWHPFTGETLEAVLRGIVDSIDRHPRRVRLIYLGPARSGGARDREISALEGAAEQDSEVSNRDLRESLSGRKRLDIVGVSLSSGSLCGMRDVPDDPAARREWLERWAAEQEANRAPRAPGSVSQSRRLAIRVERLALRVVERGLDFGGHPIEPEHVHPDRVAYLASPWWTLPRALRFLGVSDRDTFVDFGCGKGRVVHQAAKRPFRRVIGVEISPALAEIARANLATRRHQHRCPNVEIVVADAKDFRVPDDLTIAYFWHPFTGETLEAVLRGIVDSIDRHPRRVRLIYLGPARCGGARDREISALEGAAERDSPAPRNAHASNRDLRESLSGRTVWTRRLPCSGCASGVSLSSGSLCGVRNLPDDPAARREWLERWAAEQEANRSPPRASGAAAARAGAREGQASTFRAIGDSRLRAGARL